MRTIILCSFFVLSIGSCTQANEIGVNAKVLRQYVESNQCPTDRTMYNRVKYNDRCPPNTEFNNETFRKIQSCRASVDEDNKLINAYNKLIQRCDQGSSASTKPIGNGGSPASSGTNPPSDIKPSQHNSGGGLAGLDWKPLPPQDASDVEAEQSEKLDQMRDATQQENVSLAREVARRREQMRLDMEREAARKLAEHQAQVEAWKRAQQMQGGNNAPSCRQYAYYNGSAYTCTTINQDLALKGRSCTCD